MKDSLQRELLANSWILLEDVDRRSRGLGQFLRERYEKLLWEIKIYDQCSSLMKPLLYLDYEKFVLALNTDRASGYTLGQG